jgi:spoIIIJ-associated protein
MLNKEVLTQKLDKFVALLGIDADVEYEFVEEPHYIVKVMFKGENLGYAIGNHGQNIKSIQYVLSLMLKNILKKEDDDENLNGLRVIVDIGDYRASRVETLIEMAKRKADDARILGEPVDLPPMSPADRREIHMLPSRF